ncbi:potassium channel family protein [Pontibacter sp. E15-1]|uniref:potassium channel family protein n=1 Tax=Pontibacter sp. E15-1 TaxID=2919918 RepID=UPI001F4FD4E3|nr:potassium channel family protein [Pontibacter sp. E15-1]MCJ8163377.1 potassium channel family protein [Pontibacter sp. E15-1]
MHVLYLTFGILLFVFTALDIIKTTFSSNGGGLLTNMVSKAVWKTFFFSAGKNGRSKVLEYAGPAVLMMVLLAWVTGLWSGLFLMLLSDADSVIKSTTKASTGALEKLYYAGYTLSTLGVGDYVASTNFWRVVTNVAAYSGLVFITASITYFVPVLSAVGLQSRLSLYISGMGTTPQQILANSWNGKDFSSFFDTTSDLCQMLIQHTMNHHSYPVIHYFHNSKPRLAIAPAIVLLDETYQLLENYVAEDAKEDMLKMSMLRSTLNAYLDMVQGRFLKQAEANATAPSPGLHQLTEAGIPLQEARGNKSQELKERRKMLTVLLEKDGWGWAEVYPS